jgi:hypothetical protein
MKTHAHKTEHAGAERGSAHVTNLEARLKEWGARLDELVAKAGEVGTEAKSDYRKGVEELRAKYQAAQTKLEELKSTGGDKWETVKTGVENAWSELETAFKKLTK